MTTTLPPPPPPPPPPLPAPGSGTSQTVFVDLPPAVIDRLTNTDESWFTQPIATVFAACIALLAAVVAWFSVRRQVSAEDRRYRQTSRLDLMSEALTASISLLDSARNWVEAKAQASRSEVKGMVVTAKMSPGQLSPRAKYEAAVTAALLARHKLEVIGDAAASAAAMGGFQEGVAKYARGSADLESTFSLLDNMHEAFKNDVAN